MTELAQRIKDQGFLHFGFATLKRPLSIEIYRQWLDQGQHAGMDYLRRHLPYKENPQLLMPKARSAIAIAQPYAPPPPRTSHLAHTRTALYAQSPDYHFWFQEKLEVLKNHLAEVYQDHEFLCYTDSKPVSERDLAARAGLGWIGKNGCLINRELGSLFFIGEIFTSLDLDEGALTPDFCGTCDRCIRACPTLAITEQRTLDANLCLAYWNVEAKDSPPVALRSKFQDLFFGCDICQTVCPWNEKVFGRNVLQKWSEGGASPSLEDDLHWLLTASNKDMETELAGLSYLRARPAGLRRNALIVVANLQLENLRPDVARVASTYPELKELADWTLAELETLS